MRNDQTNVCAGFINNKKNAAGVKKIKVLFFIMNDKL